MKEIPKHKFKLEWCKDIEIKVAPLEYVLNTVGERMSAPHSHDFHQLVYVKKGDGIHEVDFCQIKMSKGQLVPVLSGQVHSFLQNNNLEGWNIVFTSAFIAQDPAFTRLLHKFTLYSSILQPAAIESDSEINTLFEMIHNCFEDETAYGREEMLRNYLRLIILKLDQLRVGNTDFATNKDVILSLKFNEAIENNLDYRTRVSDICDELHVDTKKLSKAIKETMRKTPKEILTDRIILEIKRLLSYSELSIKEIAYRIGFSDIANFTNYFKKQTQQTPSDFRSSTYS